MKNPVAKISIAVLSTLTLSVAMTGAASAAAVRTGLFNTSSIPANDDGSAPITALGFDANFFGNTYANTYVNNNGNFTFTGRLGTFTPFSLTSTRTPIIA